MSRIIAAFCAFLVVTPLPASSRNVGRLAVNIKNMSGNPLRDAIIKIFKEVRRNEILLVTQSDDRGFFQSAQLAPGTYFLEVSRQGYKPVTATKFRIDPGQTTSLDVVLKDLIDYIDNSEDRRNWDIETLMRSTSDRRMIFRDLPGAIPPLGDDGGSAFYRSGVMNIASSSSVNESSYLFHPQASQNGVSTNFAYAEPLSPHSRMILSGQMDFGSGTFWRLRDTFHYRPDSSHDYKVSVGYGRMNVSNPGNSTIQSQLLSTENNLEEPGIQTIAFGVEGNTRLLDIFAVKYGFDYSRLHYRTSRSFIDPSIQIIVTPAQGWSFRTSFASRRTNDRDTVTLPDGEVMDLSEPTLITMVGNQASMSQIRHSEIAMEKRFSEATAVEVSIYQDRIKGPGLPLIVTMFTPLAQKSQVLQLNEDDSSQRGARFIVKQKISDNLGGSLAYVYGESATIAEFNDLISSECLNRSIADFLRRSYQHSITGSLNATIPQTKTTLLAVLRWYPQHPLIPVDWFSDRMDIGTKSTNFEIRQAVPLPDLMGSDGQWDFWVDLRNVLNQGTETLPVPDGEIVLNRNPRSVRFGISLNFR